MRALAAAQATDGVTCRCYAVVGVVAALHIENNWRMPLITKAEQIYLCNLFEAFDTPKLGYLPGFAHVFESFARNSTVSLIESDFLEKISIQFSHNNVNLNLLLVMVSSTLPESPNCPEVFFPQTNSWPSAAKANVE